MTRFGRIGLVAVASALIAACQPIGEDLQRSQRDLASTRQQVQKDLKAIQRYGEVEIELHQQLTAVDEAYRKHVAAHGAGPGSWNDLMIASPRQATIQEAQRQQGFVRFGLSGAELADDQRKSETLIALRSANDQSIWAVTFDGEIVPMDATAFSQLDSGQ
jgi:hypothetical protein